MFDGVHLGHQAVIGQAVTAARSENGYAAALTFWPHPSVLFRPQHRTLQIMTPEAKRRVIGRLGIEALITQAFTPEFAGIMAGDFLPLLQRKLPTLKVLYVGENWRFGRGREGDIPMLKLAAGNLGLTVVSTPRVRFDDEGISSTRIRSLLLAGEIEQANLLLGYNYFVTGRVMPGKGLGSKIGFPTLNLNWSPELTPHFGVYAVQVRREATAEFLPAVANYGVRPTVETATEPRLEVHVLSDCDFGPGDELTVELRTFIRAEQKFSEVGALQAQIAVDRETARQWLAKNP
ncbi:MAG: riboflavin biosynthesis protein RibF [Cephaloticoccus sp.]|nr:riboflavin biosynthesis protein RibF [Cephaloticoccus sp.]